MGSVGSSCCVVRCSFITILDILVANNTKHSSLIGKSVLVCTYATQSTMKMLNSMMYLGSNIIYVPATQEYDHTLSIHTNATMFETAEQVICDIISQIAIIFGASMRVSKTIYVNSKYVLKKTCTV